MKNITVSDDELRTLSTELFQKDIHNVYKRIAINYQAWTSAKNVVDMATEPLLTIPSEIFTIPIIQVLLELYDNYFLDVRDEEYVTMEKIIEQDKLIEMVLATDIMLRTMTFLCDKGFFECNLEKYKEVLNYIWFHVYSRGQNIYGSSGFEHVFLAERKKGNRILGLHNWIFYGTEEMEKRANYYGLVDKIMLNNTAVVVQIRFLYDETPKTSTMFIGTSLEFEMALYTLCFFARPNRCCKVSCDGTRFGIQTYIWEEGDECLLAAAFPMR
ncbi:poly(U)-specific endoribonuclease homolog isoform X2 [Orussus abietinus]|nr:poly(U)-specific endoribonuclease homolog isoform X2 [Orussus abietinus]